MMLRRRRSRNELDFWLAIIALVLAGFAIWMFVAMVWSGCGPVFPVLDPPGPPEPEDAGTIDDCGPACKNLERLQCPGWRGSPGADEIWGTADDYSCETACRNIMYQDPTATLYPICTAQAESCEAVEWCFQPQIKVDDK